MPQRYGRTNLRLMESAGSSNAKRMLALQRSLLGYLGGDGLNPATVGGNTMMWPGGLTFEDIGFEGELVPSAGPMLEDLFGRVSGFADSPEQAARMGAVGRLLSGEQSFTADPALRERYFNQAIRDPAMRSFERDIAPMIAARYGRGGNLGAASFHTAQAGGELAGNLAGLTAGLLRDDEVRAAASKDAALGRMAGAVPLSFQAQSAPLGLLGTYGAAERAIRGEQNAGRFQQAIMNTPFGDPRLGLFSMLPGGVTGTPSPVAAPSAGGGALGAGMGLLGSFMQSPLSSGLFSKIGGLFG